MRENTGAFQQSVQTTGLFTVRILRGVDDPQNEMPKATGVNQKLFR